MAAASALRQADRLEDAEVWYRHAASLRPHEARSHTNLGAILHLNGKYKQAAAAYSEALRLQPGDATTIMNLHKLAAILAEVFNPAYTRGSNGMINLIHKLQVALLASRSCQSPMLKKAECGNTARMHAPTSLAGSYDTKCLGLTNDDGIRFRLAERGENVDEQRPDEDVTSFRKYGGSALLLLENKSFTS
ncbi:hypothetical protein WN51_14543 [Melipona quadrifasciata]|uniref:Uncharacterized protein n=1 Tax=Melipona quadrifasciata TaxID=166423 RepID=A0A0M9A0Z3_9HYME|nr:hypothetical protein WN51_14543 [Melipona quadrifasciata]